MNNTLTPVQGCLIKLDVNGELGYGIVSQIKNEETGESETQEIIIHYIRWKAEKGGGLISKPIHPERPGPR